MKKSITRLVAYLLGLIFGLAYTINKLRDSNNPEYITNTSTFMMTSPTYNSLPVYMLPKGKAISCEYDNNGFSMCSWKFSAYDEPIVGWTELKNLDKK